MKIETKKIQIEAKSKIGSLQNTSYKPGGGDKKIETRKLEYNAKSKVGSIINLKHVPGGGNVKVISRFQSSRKQNSRIQIQNCKCNERRRVVMIVLWNQVGAEFVALRFLIDLSRV